MDYHFKKCPICQEPSEVEEGESIDGQFGSLRTCKNNFSHKDQDKEVFCWLDSNKKEVCFNLRIEDYQLSIDYENNITRILRDESLGIFLSQPRISLVLQFNYAWEIPNSEEEFLSKLKTILTFM